MKNYSIKLGSKSPRRKQLLEGIGFSFEVIEIDIDESFPADLNPLLVPEFVAINKFEEAKKLIGSIDLLITADTTVIIQNEILNKPQNFDEAFAMLTQLSGQKHEVVTGVCIGTIDKQISFSEKTDVYFEELTPDELTYYINNFKPYDKAGSYGIQEFIGYIGIKKIEGCFYNVMGLPIRKVYQTLKTFNIGNPSVNFSL